MQFQLYVRISKSSSSSNKQIKSTPSSSLVMQQLIIYMSISTSESTEASHFDDMNVTDFLEA
jgi:CRISPR/Cas system-associated protein endoribonuclease Cas2